MLVTLKNMKNGKYPGLDGFTTELYKFFWSDLKYFAVRSFNQAYTRGVSEIRYVNTFIKRNAIAEAQIL
jgi:hypothetical protein